MDKLLVADVATKAVMAMFASDLSGRFSTRPVQQDNSTTEALRPSSVALGGCFPMFRINSWLSARLGSGLQKELVVCCAVWLRHAVTARLGAPKKIRAPQIEHPGCTHVTCERAELCHHGGTTAMGIE